MHAIAKFVTMNFVVTVKSKKTTKIWCYKVCMSTTSNVNFICKTMQLTRYTYIIITLCSVSSDNDIDAKVVLMHSRFRDWNLYCLALIEANVKRTDLKSQCCRGMQGKVHC